MTITNNPTEITDEQADAMRLKWIVEFEVSGNWIQDGFNLTQERALAMLQHSLNFAYAYEIAARVLSAPEPALIFRLQGHSEDEIARLALEMERDNLTAERDLINARRREIATALANMGAPEDDAAEIAEDEQA